MQKKKCYIFFLNHTVSPLDMKRRKVCHSVLLTPLGHSRPQTHISVLFVNSDTTNINKVGESFLVKFFFKRAKNLPLSYKLTISTEVAISFFNDILGNCDGSKQNSNIREKGKLLLWWRKLHYISLKID